MDAAVAVSDGELAARVNVHLGRLGKRRRRDESSARVHVNVTRRRDRSLRRVQLSPNAEDAFPARP